MGMIKYPDVTQSYHLNKYETYEHSKSYWLYARSKFRGFLGDGTLFVRYIAVTY